MLRVLIILLFFLSITTVILIAFFLPSFFFAEYKDQTVNNQAQSVNIADVNKYESAVSLMKHVDGMTKILSSGYASSTIMTDSIDAIISLKNSHITISAISLSLDSSAHMENISVSGISNSRDDLTFFYNDLKGDGSFQNVVLPVSSLIGDAGAPFTITLSYRN